MRRFTVVWPEQARQDLLRIVDWIAADSPVNADRVFVRLERSAAGLRHLASRGRVVQELHGQGITSVREIVESPWRIVYKLDGARVLVVGVFDGRRQLFDLLLERFLRI